MNRDARIPEAAGNDHEETAFFAGADGLQHFRGEANFAVLDLEDVVDFLDRAEQRPPSLS
eukprot:CAMPEP_0206609084 /NCGR_PEP_ID=MMETSP0325_2-20121206/53509_1 /ASSEMBLY_ACC=CAM_ASM_000347 /TAXON_ID=2866 /ORGANISM="Crypthecodinium cohnii, Strain Seligo" /LENGTH=59 /DNA_ID=CAMNT_0054127169 /DNA_START=150 /DNA_END=329 /DNA_ORIENTATION=-